MTWQPFGAAAAIGVTAAALMTSMLIAANTVPPIVPDCRGKQVTPSVKANCTRAARGDAIMQQSFDRVMPGLPADGRAGLVAEQAEWVADLGDSCLWFEGNTRTEDQLFPSTAGDFDCLTERMEMRTRIVRALERTEQPRGLEGEYTTWMGGGYLSSSDPVGSKADFQISVVQGSSTGDISGELTLSEDGRTGVFLDNDSSDPESPCRLHFEITPLRIEIDEDGCGAWRGAGATFSGTYYRMASAPETVE